MNDKTQTLLNLLKENPDLPVVPMVAYEVVCDDYYYRWMGSIGDCYVGEYACYGDKFFTEREDFEETYYFNNEEELDETFNYKPIINQYNLKRGSFTQKDYEENESNEKLLNEYLHKIADKYFKKAIIVNIDLPNDDLVLTENENNTIGK